MNNPPLWWLSFADDDGFRGGCMIRARSLTHAIVRTHALGINPGGEVRAAFIPGDTPVEVYELNRLYSKAEIDVIDGAVSMSEVSGCDDPLEGSDEK